jgi:hypothetical protein
MAYTQNNAYGDVVRQIYANQSSIDQLVAPANRRLITQTDRGAGVTFEFQKLTDGTVTELSANTAEAPSGSTDVIPVSIAAYEYGKGADAEVFPWSLFQLRATVNDQVMNKIKVVSHKAVTALNKIGLAHVHTTIGGGDNSAYVHSLGPNDQGAGVMGWTSPTASNLVRYGIQSGGSRTNRNLIDATDVYDVTWLRRQKARLIANKAMPLTYTMTGDPVYALITHPFVLTDLLGSMKLNDFPTVMNFIDASALAARGLNVGIVGIYEGVLLLADNNMIYAAGGHGGINVYPAVMVGENFLGKPYAPAEQLPPTMDGGEKMGLPEGAAIYVQPYGSIHGARQGVVSWYAYLGYGIFDPLSQHRLEVASTAGGAI